MTIPFPSISRSFSPLAVGTVHFVGIGGIGMSGIAEILHALGYTVQGSDLHENANVKRLRAKGISVVCGHDAANLGAAHVVVASSAVKPNNPEIVAARAARLPVLPRAEMLGELMRFRWSVAVAGTHGKTTTTSLVAALFDAAKLDPTVINGGIINAYGTNARLGAGDWMVVETDESDGSFTRLPATIGIVTNMDPEHLDHYGTFESVREAYRAFVTNLPFYGFAVLCADHPEVQELIARVSDRAVVTYGFSPQADVRAVNLVPSPEGTRFDVRLAESLGGSVREIHDLFLPMMGQHNVQNALAVVAVGWKLGFGESILRAAFGHFQGVKRRFTCTGVVGGVTIIDDYGHHPVEIATTLRAAQQAKGEHGRVLAVVQPHRYSRVRDLFTEFCTCFNDADSVILADIYPAGEEPLPGITRTALAEGLRAHGHKDVVEIAGPEDLAPLLAERTQPGDYVICLGAGSVSQWAQALPGELQGLVAPGALRASGA